MAFVRRNVVGFEQLTGISASTALASIPAEARSVLMQAEGQPVRWRPDGDTTAPTAAIGMRLLITEHPMFYEGNLSRLRFIQEAATGSVNVTYFDS